QQAALVQRLHHQAQIALFQVAHTAVHQLGAAAGCPFAEVVLFDEERGVAAAGRVHGDAGAGGAAADDDEVPGTFVLLEALIHFRSGHGWAGTKTSTRRPVGSSAPGSSSIRASSTLRSERSAGSSVRMFLRPSIWPMRTTCPAKRRPGYASAVH